MAFLYRWINPQDLTERTVQIVSFGQVLDEVIIEEPATHVVHVAKFSDLTPVISSADPRKTEARKPGTYN